MQRREFARNYYSSTDTHGVYVDRCDGEPSERRKPDRESGGQRRSVERIRTPEPELQLGDVGDVDGARDGGGK